MWFPATRGDAFHAFATCEDALATSEDIDGAKPPLALILQRKYIDEPTPGADRHVVEDRVTEWPVVFLSRPQRTDRTIPDFLSPNAPENRLAILRGEAPPPDRA